MTKRTGNAGATQAGNGRGEELAEALTPLIAGMSATRTQLLEWVHTLGVGALHAVFTAEAEALAGPKGKHQVDRTHHHWGRTATELTFGGRRIQVARPRVRSRAGQEAVLPAVAAWRGRDPVGREARHPGRPRPLLCGARLRDDRAGRGHAVIV